MVTPLAIVYSCVHTRTQTPILNTMNTTNTAPILTSEQIAQCRKVHLAIVAQANANGIDAIEYAEHLGPEAFEDVVANELAAQSVDPNVWDAWYASPDAQTEFEQNMGADIPELAPSEFQRTFAKVMAIAYDITNKREQDGTTTPKDAVTVAAAYLLACDRHRCFHHPEDAPNEVVWASHEAPHTDEELDAIQTAWTAVWAIIGDASTKTNAARYEAAWAVWTVMVGEPSMS